MARHQLLQPLRPILGQSKRRIDMALGDLTSKASVAQTIVEYDSFGRDHFLEKYGFGRSRAYFLVYGGKHYDSKAIVSATHGFQFGSPLRSQDFSGGKATVKPQLESLGRSLGIVSISRSFALCTTLTREFTTLARSFLLLHPTSRLFSSSSKSPVLAISSRCTKQGADTTMRPLNGHTQLYLESICPVGGTCLTPLWRTQEVR
jgi:hypothetical protein